MGGVFVCGAGSWMSFASAGGGSESYHGVGDAIVQDSGLGSEEQVVNKLHKTARVLAVVFAGVLFGLYKHAQQVRWAGLGRQAFLADQSHQFDVGMAPPHGTFAMILAGIVLAGITFGIYELLAAGIALVLPRHQPAEE
jgi:hypothetical protein